MNEIKVGLIGGSGLGQLLRDRAQGAAHQVETPFGPPSDAILEMQWEGLTVYFLSRHGPGHLLNPSQVPYRANIYAMKKLGVTHVIASGAVGSLREEFKPRDLVVPDQIIDKTHKRANTFYERAAVHVEFAEPFDPVLRRILIEEGAKGDTGTRGHGDAETETGTGTVSSSSSVPPSPRPPVSPSPFTTHARGCYVCMEGPAFSTRAESLMHRLWGGDLIGMTCMPEAKLAREAEIAYALVALVTDYDCWRKPPVKKDDAGPVDPAELLKEIIANLQAASDNAATLIGRALRRIAADPQTLAASPALSALKLAIWSDKNRVPRDQVELLAPLWMKYFGENE
ncbi:MAG TPA: MTAP family purine nucleoside phosphorylase [Tepidisphaeraceae bacterium]|jgi:5'-methylthioadenosine phosphorylase